METQNTATQSGSWPRRLVNFDLVWAILTLIIAVVETPNPESITLLIAISGSGLYTLVLYVTRTLWLPLLGRYPLRNAVLIGVLNAAVIETLFLVLEHLLGAVGVAAHPNLLIDLILTMPWYVLIVYTFVHVQHRRRFSSAVVLLLGAIYETGGDGIVGPFLSLVFGDSLQFLDPAYYLMLGLVAFWQFILVYSAMVLPPTWLIAANPATAPPSTPA